MSSNSQFGTLTIKCNGLHHVFTRACANLRAEQFAKNLSSVFQIDENRIIGLKDNKNNVYNLGSFCQVIGTLEASTFDLLVATEQTSTAAGSSPFYRAQTSVQTADSNTLSNNNLSNSGNGISTQNGSAARPLTQRQKRARKSYGSIASLALPDGVELIEDYEFFVHCVVRRSIEELFVVLFFDDYDKMQKFGTQLHLRLEGLGIKVYYTLYPSKRSRGPFVVSEESYLLSMYKGQELLFERELPLNEVIPSDVVDLVQKTIANQQAKRRRGGNNLSAAAAAAVTNNNNNNPVFDELQDTNVIGNALFDSERRQVPSLLQMQQLPAQSAVNRSASPFSKSIVSQELLNQNSMFELIEAISTNNIRSKFTDEEFSDLLVLARKQSKSLFGAFETYKIFNDDREFEDALKKLLHTKTPPSIVRADSNFELSFDTKDESGNFITLEEKDDEQHKHKNAQKKTKKLKKTKANAGLAAFSSILPKKKGKQNRNNDSMKFARNLKAAMEQAPLKNGLQIESKAFVWLMAKREDPSLVKLIQSLKNDRILKNEIGLKCLIRESQKIKEKFMRESFTEEEIRQLESEKRDRYSPITSAYYNLYSLGDWEECARILRSLLDQKAQIQEDEERQNGSQNFSKSSPKHKSSGQRSQQMLYDFPTVTNNVERKDQNRRQSNQNGNRSSKSSPYNLGDNVIPSLSLFGGGGTSNLLHKGSQNSLTRKSSNSRKDSNSVGKDNCDSLRERKSSFKYSEIARQKSHDSRKGLTLGLISTFEGSQELELRRNQSNDYTPNKHAVRDVDNLMNQLINRYHSTLDQERFDEEFKNPYEKLLHLKELDESEKATISKMYTQRMPQLVHFLEHLDKVDEYAIERFDELKYTAIARFQEHEEDEEDELPLHMQSPMMKARVNKYKTFKKVLKYLYQVENFISKREFNLAKYLYTCENIHILAAFEVYLYTRDVKDFVENIVQIMKQQLLKNEFDNDEIEAYDEIIDKQFSILFTFKRDLSSQEIKALEKTIRLGDVTLLKLYHEYNEEGGTRETLLQKIKKFAQQRNLGISAKFLHTYIKQEIQAYELRCSVTQFDIQDMHEQAKKRKKEVISNISKLLKKLVDADDKRIMGIIEVHDYDLNRLEFVESLTMLYKHRMKQKLMEAIADCVPPKKIKNKLDKLKAQIEAEDRVLFGVWEFFLSNEDDEEFRDSIEKYLENL